MADNYDADEQKILDAIGDMSFLPQEAIDENIGRPFPKFKPIETKIRFAYTILFTLATVTFLVCLFVFGTQGYYFPTKITGSYGPLGVIFTAIFAIVFCAAHFYGYLFDSKITLERDETVQRKGQLFTIVLYYLAFFFLYTMFFFTILRHWVFEKTFPAGNGFLVNLGVITHIIIVLITAVGIFLAIKKPNIGKFYNYVILALGLWVVVFFHGILSKNYSLSDNYGIMNLIFGAIFADLSLVFLLLQKKPFCRSIFHTLLSISAIFEALTVLLQGMVQLG